MSDEPEYKTEAQNRWYEKNSHLKGLSRDRVNIDVWMPTDFPHSILKTYSGGCHDPDKLPDGPPIAHVTISGIRFGGYLDELEMLFDAVREQIENVRAEYERMKQQELEA